MPDDHDVGQPNLWGESGKISTLSGAADGGYSQPGAYVQEVERAQTSHLPDPADPHQIGQGIGVYFTNLNWGNIDFAILEDRKFKTGPAGRVPKQGPRPDHIQNPAYDPSVPSIANLYLRWWEPLEPGRNREPGAPLYTGDILDGFANRVTNYAAANPEKKPAGNLLNTRAAGYGIVRLNTKTRQITMECWPRNVDVTDPHARQYPGWPRTISQFDNYSPPSWGKLGELTFDIENPVVQLVDANSNEVLYTVRANGTTFTPSAPEGKTFIIKAGKDAPDTTVVTDARIGGESSAITLK